MERGGVGVWRGGCWALFAQIHRPKLGDGGGAPGKPTTTSTISEWLPTRNPILRGGAVAPLIAD